jgi:hypothetical protein
MTEDGAPGGAPGSGRVPPKVGWYRDRKSGQRRFWNGDAWVDLADAITALTVESEPAPAVPPPSPSGRGRATNTRTKVIAVIAFVVVVAAVAVGLDVSHGANARPRHPQQSHAPPAYSSATSPLAAATTTPSTSAITTSPTTTSPTTTPPTTTPPAATVSVGSGITSPAVSSPPQTPAAVAIIGDSITALARTALEHTFHGYDLFIDAVGGTRMADHLPTIERVESDGQPRDWVIELGTNDAARPPLNVNWASDFANEVTALKSQRCVVFVSVNPKLGPISVGINDAIATAVATHPNFHLIDWGDIEFRKPQWLLPDGIHPSKSGIAELARLEHRAVLNCQGE